MTEFEKMRNEEFYDFTNEECLASYYRAKHLCAKLQTMTIEDADYRETIEALIPGIPDSLFRHHSIATMGMASNWVRMSSSTTTARCSMVA